MLAEQVRSGQGQALDAYLAQRVFAGADLTVAEPDSGDVAGYAAWLETYSAGLAIERAAVEAIH
ncbi:hypothetical protein GCM10025876_30610 [Demequina litorisediminis]|uniref:Uncharacterized protein n=1 Tax=Demequina litorisediminis TaxID=1849022 RepID=A0ABQ6II68_9MICO|nr:hypothetical protein GCM10025876_30610 [Demequina litorisediminis]